MGFNWVTGNGVSSPCPCGCQDGLTNPDDVAVAYARKHLDLNKSLNEQGYFGPLPNDANPVAQRRPHERSGEYYEFMVRWLEEHQGKCDNEQMQKDWRRYESEEWKRQHPGQRRGIVLTYYGSCST